MKSSVTWRVFSFPPCFGALAAHVARTGRRTKWDRRGQLQYQAVDRDRYRFTNVSGSQQTYDTFVNLQQGPRLLGFTTHIRSLDYHGTCSTICFSATLAMAATERRLPTSDQQEQVVRLQRHVSPRPESLGLFLAGESAESNPTRSQRSAQLQSNHQCACKSAGDVPDWNSPDMTSSTRRNMQNYNLTIMPESIVFVSATIKTPCMVPATARSMWAPSNICCRTIPSACNNTGWVSTFVSYCERPSVMTKSGVITGMICPPTTRTSNFLLVSDFLVSFGASL